MNLKEWFQWVFLAHRCDLVLYICAWGSIVIFYLLHSYDYKPAPQNEKTDSYFLIFACVCFFIGDMKMWVKMHCSWIARVFVLFLLCVAHKIFSDFKKRH